MHFRLDDNHGAQFLGPVSYLKSTRSIDKFETIIPWKLFQLILPNYYFFWLISNIFAGFSETNSDLLRADTQGPVLLSRKLTRAIGAKLLAGQKSS